MQTVDGHFPSPPPLTLLQCTQLRAMFLINTGCAYAYVTKPVHMEQVQLLVIYMAIQLTYNAAEHNCAPLYTACISWRACISLIVKSVFVIARNGHNLAAIRMLEEDNDE